MVPLHKFSAYQMALQHLLTNLLAVYYAEHRTICILRTLSDDIRIATNSLPTLQLAFDDSRDDDAGGNIFVELLRQAVESGCGGFVVTNGQLLLSLLDRFHEVHTGLFARQDANHLIAVIPPPHLEEPIFRDKLENHMILESLLNILLLVPNETGGTVELYTTHLRPTIPIGITIELLKIGELELTNNNPSALPLSELDFFPDKISNMQGRRIRVTTLFYPPCTAWTEVPLGEGNAMDINDTSHALLVDGVELILVLEFCRRHNCTIEMDIGLDWGNIQQNGTTTGILGNVVHHRADLVLAAIYEWHTGWQVMSITMPIGISSVSCLVPKPRRLPFWQTPFLSFPPSLWLMVGVSFVVGMMVIFVTDLYRHHHRLIGAQQQQDHGGPTRHDLLLFDALFFMISLYVEQSARLRNDLIAAVILTTALLFGGFMIGNSYAGALASIMTLPRYEKPINTVADFNAHQMRWTGGSMAWMTSLAEATDPAVIRMRDSFEVHDDATRTRLSHTDERMGYIYERFQYGNYGFGTSFDLNTSRQLQSMTQILYREYTGGFCSKVWPLRVAFDRMILELHQTGIFHYLELTSVIRLSGLAVQRNIANARAHDPSDDEPVRLTLDHFLGVFFILFTGFCLATLGFVTELMFVFVVCSLNKTI